MKFTKLRNIFLLCTVLSSIQLWSQVLDLVQMKSPQSYAFEKNGNVPVNLYTGSIDMKIPVASIGGNEADISATLVYDSSGFIPHKKSDAAGVNWSLIAGGRITRKMNIIPDEYIGQPTGTGTTNNPYYQSRQLHGFLTGVRANPSTNVLAYNVSGTGTGHTDGTEWLMGPDAQAYEGEPDEFSFNAMGISGKFMIGNDGNVLVESNDSNIKVDLSQMALYGGSGFCEPPVSIITITDGKGNKYIFGGDLSKYEISYSYSIEPDYPNDGYNGHPMINSFSLAKIILANKKEITFDYEEGTISTNSFCFLNNWTNLRENSKIFSMDSYTQDGGKSDSWADCSNNCNNPSYVAPLFNGPSKKTTFSLLKKSVLKSIKYQDDEIKINYIDTGYPILHYTLSPFYTNRALKEWVIGSVETYHKNDRITKQELSYDHLGGEFRRPFLKSIQNVNSSQKYKFEYYKTDYLPPYYTKGIDHWGYWNGRDNNVSLSPFDTATSYGDYTLNNTFRDPDPERYNVALLQKITYPNKGISVFEYEPHVYSNRIERTASNSFLPALTINGGMAGGARIKKIATYTENGQPSSKKEYRYIMKYNNPKSSGILMTWPRYFYHIQMLSGGIFRELILRASSNVQVNSLDSYNVGYQSVIEIEEGKGYVQHAFTNYDSHPDLVDTDPSNNATSTGGFSNIVPINLYANLKNLYGIDQSALRGRIFGQSYYSQTDLVNPIKEVFYNYYDNMDFNPNSSLDNNNYVSVNHSSGIWTQAYRRFMNSAPLKTILTQDYSNGSEMRTTTEYIYDAANHLNLTNEKVEVNYGLFETKYKYAKDFGTGGDLNANNFTGIPLVTTKYRYDVPLSKTKLNFSKNWLGHDNLLPSSQQSVNSIDKIDTPNETYEQDITYGQYDNKGNVLEYSSENGIPTTIIYGYNRTLPIAKIEGIGYTSFMNTMGLSGNLSNYEVLEICQKSNTDSSQTPGSDETDLIQELENFRKQFPNYQVTTYTYDPLIGIRSITPPSGIRENYSYDTANRLKHIIDMNGNILKEFNYNYSPKNWYYSGETSKVFRSVNCGSNAVSSPVTYTVPAYKYASDISQGDADYKAGLDLNTNGQNLANSTTTCIPFNCPLTFNASLGITGTASVSAVNSEGHYVVTLSFNTGPNSATYNWWEEPGVKVATITGTCRPTYEIYSFNTDGDVFYTIQPNGDIYIQPFNTLPNNTSYNLELPIYFD